MRKPDPCNKSALCFGLVASIISFGVRAVTKNPFDLIHKLNCSDFFPPIRLYNILCTVWFFLIGYAAGLIVFRVIKRRICGNKLISTYKGGLFFLCGFFFSLSWYPVLFGAENIFLSFVLALSAALCFATCARMWVCVAPIPTLITVAYTLWLVYIFVLIITVFFKC